MLKAFPIGLRAQPNGEFESVHGSGTNGEYKKSMSQWRFGHVALARIASETDVYVASELQQRRTLLKV